MDGLENLWRNGKRLCVVRALTEALLQVDEEEIDQVKLLAELLGALAVQVVEDAGELIGIGAASLPDRSPPTPPGMRVRTGRFESLRL